MQETDVFAIDGRTNLRIDATALGIPPVRNPEDVAAKQLPAMDGIEVAFDLDSVEYFHILFDRHEIIRSNGAEMESLFSGPQALCGLGHKALDEVQALFPQLLDRDYVTISARGFVASARARKLAARHVRNGVALASPDEGGR